MSNGWQEVYSELTDFIAEHSEVEIGASSVSLPDNVRREFYRLFGAVRMAFIKEKLPDLLSETQVLSESYTKAEEEVIKLLGLDELSEVSMVASLHRFLHDPIDELKRELFDPLFDLLKAKVGVETFDEGALRNLETNFRDLYRLGYEKWAVLSLIKLLEADKLLQVITRELLLEEIHWGPSEVEVPAPVESRRLSFRHEMTAALTVPDFVVHSNKINRYVSARSEYREAMTRASRASEQREWYPLDSVVALGTGLTLIYVADNPEELSLVADTERICKPGLIIECRGQKDWYEKEGLEKVKIHHYSLKPTLGTYIVSREPVPEQAKAGLEEGINILTVGFDQTKLEPIISAIMHSKSK